ncbi:MAG TPA: c-type cytochrome biogenesis protein CcmI [Alphaproteobacteria bacterium]|nr:c-type cytochrome biogenesis protein CcmI [Alphaproteobacteria bacterium]
MSPWWLFLIMAALAVLFLVRPLLRTQRASVARADYDLEVYRQQLKELAFDQRRGLISDPEYQASLTEIERRILAAGGARDLAIHTPVRMNQRAWKLVLALVLVVPLLGGGLYQRLGSPQLPDQPLASRNVAPEIPGGSEFDEAIASLVSRLDENPNDVEGWTLLARSYAFTRRFNEAVGAYREAEALSPDDNDIATVLGESIVFSRDGVVTPAARQQFKLVLGREPGHPIARYYMGLAMAQSGAQDEALAIWRKLAAEADPSEPWLPQLQSQLRALTEDFGMEPGVVGAVEEESRSAVVAPSTAPGPSAADIEAAGEMTADDRANMIQSMVGRLAARLEENPDDVEGWKRLGNARRVLGELSASELAYGRALALAPNDVNALVAQAEVAMESIGDGLVPAIAVVNYLKVNELDASRLDAMWYLGLAASQKGRKGEARKFWQHLLERLPSDSGDARDIKARIDALDEGN